MKKATLIFLIMLIGIKSRAQLPLSPSGKFVQVNNAQIYYEEYGHGEPLLLLHGFLNTADNWKNFIGEYSKSYKVIVWDMRGHGRSTNPDEKLDFKHEVAARDLLELMKALSIEKAKAIGHSSGGIVLLYANIIAPDKFDAIVTVAAQNYFSEPVRNWISSKVWERYFDQSELDSLHGRIKSERLKNQFYGFAKLIGDPAISNENLRKIKARTLIVHGDNDFIPVNQAWEIYQNILGARIWISPNGGHLPQFGKHNEKDFTIRTLDFLNGKAWSKAATAANTR